MSDNKTVVVLPGAKWQIPLINKLKMYGYRVLVVNPYDESPSFPYADGHLQADIFDIKSIKQYCEEEHACALITEECDIAMPVVAELGAALGYPTLSTAAARLFTDKYAMRMHCQANGFAYPEYRLCNTLDHAREFMIKLNHPVVLKPIDSNSSRGVHIVGNVEDLESCFADSLSYSRVKKAVLVERFIEGPEFTVDGVKGPNGHATLAISKKKHFAHNKSIASELYFTASDARYDYDELRSINDKLLAGTPLEFGLTHVEYKYENDRYYLIEMAARGGGNLISSHIVPFLSRFDNYSYLIDCSVNGAKSFDVEQAATLSPRCAVLKFFECPHGGGKVARIEGIELLNSLPDVSVYAFNFKPGDRIDEASNDASRVGYYIALCNSETRLKQVMKSISEEVRIVLE
ncbi:ATP-grasp domain-containing protein [Paraeggerthella sp. Marseille-Q4926]|uniref:ATP-grasp domain-containing protein n=1 Tax=Paraeggerthella sp. Marseille-Q4926 TaxID=2866587 RepID=UPI001CE417C1|nr:ATP-grasp domain-containing protein [Paraeggerthella sp. Marseille-Q4926]